MDSIPLWPLLTALTVIGALITFWMHRIERHMASMEKSMQGFVKFVGRTETLLAEHSRRLDAHDSSIDDLRENY